MAFPQRGINNQSQKPVEGHRGALVYRQEYGYKLITMLIEPYTPDERSSVSSRADDFDIPEEVEHLPAASPHGTVDVHHFPATDGMEIVLAIRNQAGKHTAHYTVAAAGVEEHSTFVWLDVLRVSDGLLARDAASRESDDDVRQEAGGNHETLHQY
jgi:hypothetical protein